MNVEDFAENWADTIEAECESGCLTPSTARNCAKAFEGLVDGDACMGLAAFGRLCLRLDVEYTDELLDTLEDIDESP